VLIPYEITATDIGTAISIAQQRAHRDGYTHVSINSTRQTGTTTWTITVFVSNAQGLTRRGPGWVEDGRGGHWCEQPSLCAYG
jgi:hypothetical protein